MHIITNNEELAKLCEQVSNDEFVTIDTEFIREKSYFPQLCLLQVAGSEVAAIIDPLAGFDLSPLLNLLQCNKVKKVFHAGRQDLEIFYHLFEQVPQNIYDTQIAASMCGYGDSISYDSLVSKITGAELDKGARYTNWADRPLTDRQLEYAMSDVTYLRKIYTHLQEKLRDLGRENWVEEEFSHLKETSLYAPNPEEAWKRLRYNNLRPRNLAALQQLAKWREIEAIKKDIPKGRIIKDEALLELAVAMPQKFSDFARMRGLDKNINERTKREII